MFPPRAANTAAMLTSTIKLWVQVGAELIEMLKYVSYTEKL